MRKCRKPGSVYVCILCIWKGFNKVERMYVFQTVRKELESENNDMNLIAETISITYLIYFDFEMFLITQMLGYTKYVCIYSHTVYCII